MVSFFLTKVSYNYLFMSQDVHRVWLIMWSINFVENWTLFREEVADDIFITGFPRYLNQCIIGV